MFMFKDRYDAAQQLARKLIKYKNNPNTVIIAIPRGALEIGYVLAKELHLPLDVVLIKKIGAPGNPELAIGALSMHSRILDPSFSVDMKYVEEETMRLKNLLKERYKNYYKKNKPIDLKNKIVILTDDGIATGNTMFAAVNLIQEQEPQKIIIALPVGPTDTIKQLKEKVDIVICLLTPEPFYAIGAFYQNFAQVDDTEAIRLLHEANT
ncbi:MAG TPA: phosphoribosyltransferase family protein [Candidatus Babeliales bacterium]|nr:phosphoribosyltransferase family protein [Candidatus Babeliales bacterium]